MTRPKAKETLTVDDVVAWFAQELRRGGSCKAWPTSESSSLQDAHLRLSAGLASKLVRKKWLEKSDPKRGSVYYSLTLEGLEAVRGLGTLPEFDPQEVISYLRETILFKPSRKIDHQTAIPSIYRPGSSPWIFVLGENASGKSLFRRVFRQLVHPGKAASFGNSEFPAGPFPVSECITSSMEARTSSSLGAAFVYGNEGYSSTGEISSSSTMKAVRACFERRHFHVACLDEPDLGTSSGASAGLGAWLVARMPLSPFTRAIVITTHSPSLVEAMLPLDPHYVYLGDPNGPATLADWLEEQQHPRRVDPETLSTLARDRFRLIQKVLDDGNKKK